MMTAHRVRRSTFMFTLVTLLAVVSWTATTLGLAAPTCSLKPRAENSTTSGVITSNTGGSNATISTSAGRAGLDKEDVIATSWFAGWLSDSFPPSAVPWEKYNMMTYAFALTTEDPSKLDLNGEEAVLKTFVTEAHRNGVKALLSVGGWTGSQHFSTAVASAASRTTFTKTITGIATQYNLDGIDFDWEYPNADGIGCNTKSPEDTENFLTFLKQLRTDSVGSKLILTAAAGVKPFAGPDATPLADVSAFSEVLDFIAIMNYDVFGSWSTTTGPNAPLDDACASEGSRFGSAESAVEAWTGAQFPTDQLLLGLASYGHSFFVDNTAAKTAEGTLDVYSAFNKAKQPFGQGEDAANTAVADKCGNQGAPSGVFYFNGLIEAGFLDADGNPADGIDYTFDACSQTPFVYQQSSQTLVSFDDAKSFAAKGEFINSKGLKGFAVWHVAGDSKDNILLTAVHDAMGIATECPNDDGDAAPPTEGDAGDSDDGSGGDAGVDEDGSGGADDSDGGDAGGGEGGEGDNSDGGDDSTGGDGEGGDGGAGDGGAGDGDGGAGDGGAGDGGAGDGDGGAGDGGAGDGGAGDGDGGAGDGGAGDGGAGDGGAGDGGAGDGGAGGGGEGDNSDGGDGSYGGDQGGGAGEGGGEGDNTGGGDGSYGGDQGGGGDGSDGGDGSGGYDTGDY